MNRFLRVIFAVILTASALPTVLFAQATDFKSEDLATLQQQAASGNADAQIELGIRFHSGRGVPQDYAQAVAWFRKAAEQGNAVAQEFLGIAYMNGLGVPQDYAQARAWYQKAANQVPAAANQLLATLDQKQRAAQQSGALPTQQAPQQSATSPGVPATYDNVIAQAKADLSAGRNDQALAGSQKAIGIDPSRWEVYLIAGSALENQKQFDAAIDNYSKALERAPEAKKAGVRSVLEQCKKLSAASGPKVSTPAATAEGPTFKETLEWLISRNAQEGYTYTAVSYFPNGGHSDPDTAQQQSPFGPSPEGVQCSAAIGRSTIDFSKSTPNSVAVRSFDVHKIWGMTSADGTVTKITSAQDTYFVITGMWQGASFEQSLYLGPVYSDQALANRVAKALNHAVDVCGGKGKPEAF
jgi:tetratricopeptide (TPR) repeat protein